MQAGATGQPKTTAAATTTTARVHLRLAGVITTSKQQPPHALVVLQFVRLPQRKKAHLHMIWGKVKYILVYTNGIFRRWLRSCACVCATRAKCL